MAKIGFNAQDLASGQLSLLFVQFLTDELVRKKVIEPAVVADFLKHVEAVHTQKVRTAHEARKEVERATAAFAKMVRQKYDVPPKAEQH